jgi:phosphoglucosamine mutase
MTRLFGTDGVRGRANDLLTPELTLALARATAQRLIPKGGRVIIGHDTRVSGPMLEGALAAGFAASGADVLLAGLIPTPAISFLIKDERADLGAVISASHNPPDDNGIKFFDRRGMKLGMEEEAAIEDALLHVQPGFAPVGRIVPLEAAASRYAAFLVGTIEIEEIDLSGRTIVVDCAYGATGAIAPRVLRHFSARVIPLHTESDGTRINQACGSTHLEPLRSAVLAHQADLGIAFDGDGDRVLLVAPSGEVIDGDRMMGIAALHLLRKGSFEPALLVSTVMTNLGLEHTLAREGIGLLRTPVGDRHVAQAMRDHNAKLGGEQSGHIIFSDHSVTGDGILTAVKLLEIAHERGVDLHTLAAEITLYPQVRQDVHASEPEALLARPTMQQVIQTASERLNGTGRLLVRASGTQPLVRVMVEGKDEAACRAACSALAEEIRRQASL